MLKTGGFGWNVFADVGLECHRDVLGEHAGDAPVILGGNRDRGQCRGGVGRAVAADSVDPVASRRRRERAEHAFGLEERRARRHGACAAAAAGWRTGGGLRARAAGTPAGRGQAEFRLRGRPGFERRQFLGGVARGLRLPVGRHVRRGLRQHPLALQLALVGGKIGLGRGRHQHHVTADEPLRAGRPRRRRPRDRELLGGHGGEVELVVRPPALEPVPVHPGLDLHVDQAVFLQLRGGPLGRLLGHRRPGQPRRVHVGEPARQVHGLRALQALGLDLVDVDVIDGFATGLQDRAGQDSGRCDGAEQAGDNTRASHAGNSSRLKGRGTAGSPVCSTRRAAQTSIAPVHAANSRGSHVAQASRRRWTGDPGDGPAERYDLA